jgi:hypothetical protein
LTTGAPAASNATSPLLCQEIPPPPPGVGEFPGATPDAQTVRERLALHRRNPECAACHEQMDPPGLALEGFDGIGAHRSLDNGVPIDTSAEFADQSRVAGAVDLAHRVAADPAFVSCFVQKLSSYANGAARCAPEAAELLRLQTELGARGLGMRQLVELLVTGERFKAHLSPPPIEDAP